MENIGAMHGQRDGYAQRPRQQQPRMSVTREHVRMNDVKRLFPMERFGNRQRGAIEQPAAYRLFACVAQRQAAWEIHGNAVDYILLGRSPIRFGKRRTEFLHHRHHADAGDDRHIVPLRTQGFRLLMNIEANYPPADESSSRPA